MSQHAETSLNSATRLSPSSSTLPELSDTQKQIIDKCTGIVQEFRAGKISKSKATLLLQQSIPYDSSDKGAFLSAFESYFDMLKNFERHPKGNIEQVQEVQQQLAGPQLNEQDSNDLQPATEMDAVRKSKRTPIPIIRRRR